MGKIVKERYPELGEEDQEAVRQHAVAALNLTQQTRHPVSDEADTDEIIGSTAFVDGIRKYAVDVRDLDIDLIDKINPFGNAYAILAKALSSDSLAQVAAVISAKKTQLTLDEARDLARRALKFKHERGRLPMITSHDPWEKRMAEGVNYLARKNEEDNHD